jgi:hypothetical protein
MVHLSGCIIPSFSKEPYQEEEIRQVHPGETSREAIVKLFGQPDVTRENDTIWIYGKVRTAAILLGKGFAIISDFQFLAVEFEQNVVKSFELVEDAYGCSSTGICMPHGFSVRGNVRYTLTPDLTVIASKREDDQLAKRFQSVSGQCSIYIYQKYPVARVAVHSFRNVLIDYNSYLLFLLVYAGKHKKSMICCVTRHNVVTGQLHTRSYIHLPAIRPPTRIYRGPQLGEKRTSEKRHPETRM